MENYSHAQRGEARSPGASPASDCHIIVTQIVLSADRWSLLLPLVVIVPALHGWARGGIQKQGPLLMTVAHALTVAVMAVAVCGMLWPLLTSTWGMS